MNSSINLGRRRGAAAMAGALLSAGAWRSVTAAESSPTTPYAEPKAPTIDQLPGSMTLARLLDLVRKVDPDAKVNGNSAQFTIRDSVLILVGDEKAGRMRIMMPIARAESVDAEVLQRMLQANFDAVLDPRYAIAQGLIWSVFIHPLPSMDEVQLASAISQVYIAAATFGSEYTSGALVYGGGDSNEAHRQLLEELKKSLGPTI